jgi:pyruvate/2-oxoglutarate dehydrogenase complex dihydrolipoamide dehydrogenase (E3) component
MARDGVEIRLNATATDARVEDCVRVLETVNNETGPDTETDLVLLSIGRIPNTENLILARAEVADDPKRGVLIDDYSRHPIRKSMRQGMLVWT